MVAGIVAAPAVNGIHNAPPLPTDLAEYEKLIRLRDDVVAGRHPRLKAESSGLSNSQHPPNLTAANAAAFNSNHAISSLQPQNAGAPLSNSFAPGSSGTLQAQIPGQSGPRNDALPGLDAALLSGPPLLTPADRKLSRSVIQAHLTGEIKRRPHQWPKLDRENILPDYDVDDLLRKAHAEVKPMTFDKTQARERKSLSRSPDDNNSYYSSQVNEDEESGEIRTSNTTKPCTFFFKGKCNRGDACNFSHDPAFEAQLKPAAPVPQTNDKAFVNTASENVANKRARRDDSRNMGQAANLDQGSPRDQRGIVDEFGRTIPPGRVIGVEDMHDSAHYVHTPPGHRQNGSDRRFSGRVAPPTRDGPIVRNQIMSPIAPQPARVSPLASKGGPRVDNVRFDHSRVSSAQGVHQSPNSGPIQSRKRRRDNDLANSHDSGTIRRRVESPQVQIKEEPASPRPFDGVPQFRYVDREEAPRQPVLVESYPNGARRAEHDGHREIHFIDDPGYRRVSSPMVRVVSRAEPRYEVRREPELRRVVSERHSLRAASPALHSARASYYEDGQRHVGPPSVVFLSRGDDEHPSSYRASVAPPSQQTTSRAGPESSRPEFVEPRRMQSPVVQQAMAPPPVRRIIRDQYGTEFYESAAEPQRFSVAPEARYAPEHAYAPRPVSRMASAMPEPPRQIREGTVLHRREDAEPTSPRYVGAPPGARAPSAAPYARREPEYITERPQVVRLSEGGRGDEPYERVIYRQGPPQAMYAERPREGYYEQPREVYRVQSARPEGVRYGSVAPSGQRFEYVDDRARQYVQPSQDRQYVME